MTFHHQGHTLPEAVNAGATCKCGTSSEGHFIIRKGFHVNVELAQALERRRQPPAGNKYLQVRSVVEFSV